MDIIFLFSGWNWSLLVAFFFAGIFLAIIIAEGDHWREKIFIWSLPMFPGFYGLLFLSLLLILICLHMNKMRYIGNTPHDDYHINEEG